MWLITNKKNIEIKYCKLIANKEYFSVYSDEPDAFLNNEENEIWYHTGHLIARESVKLNRISNNLPADLFKIHGDKFIENIKGQFVIIKIEINKFTICSDHFASKKFFFWQNARDYIISDDLKTISQYLELTASPINMANYAVGYHFTGGTTAFEKIWHNTPAQIIKFENGHLHFSTYWQPEDLLKLEKRKISITDISKALSKSVDNSLENIDKEKVSLSLTGGADTRNLLAIFLNKGIKPHIYTYGNPASDDCIKARAIAEGMRLNHNIYDIKISPELFEEYARKIIRQGGGLASLHRAHRIMAVESEKEFAENMFLGTLGGEFIKGVSEDDYIVPSVVYENWENQNFSLAQLNEYLQKKFIKTNNIDTEKLHQLVISEPYMKGDVTQRKLNALSYITAHLHDAQDINLYATVMQNIFTPFLDIDYLELIFSSEFTFDNKEKIKNKYLKRVNNPIYASTFIKVTYPPLLKYLYSGDHLPSEVLFNKFYAAFMKVYRKRKNRNKYKSNFPLGKWMEKFVENNLPLCYEHKILEETFDLDGLMRALKKNNHKPKEAYWLKFTNPIMMRFIIEEFTQ